MSLAAILFDVDGTLADTEPDGHLPAYNEAFREFGLDWHWSLTLYRGLLLTAGGRERIAYFLDHHRPPLGAQAAAVARDRVGWINALHRCKARHFRARLERGLVSLRPGVARVMREAARAGLAIALVTNATRSTLNPFIECVLGPVLAAGVSLSVCGDEVEHKKPAPDLYLTACARLERRPEECLAIEDSEAGVTAASAAGVPALVTINADTREQCFSKACAVVESLGDPGAPTVVRRGPGFDSDWIDVAALRRIHGEALSAGAG